MRLFSAATPAQQAVLDRPYYDSAHTAVLLSLTGIKFADNVISYGLAGRLYLSKSGWLLLQVPNAIGRGAFDALYEQGVELPTRDTNDPNEVFNCHISVMNAKEVAAIGVDKISERGKVFHYTLGPVKEITPTTWEGVSKVWAIEVNSPELRQLRKSYGLSPLPGPNGGYPYHITFAIRKTNVLKHNDVSKAAHDVHATSPVQVANPQQLAGNAGSLLQPATSPVQGLRRSGSPSLPKMAAELSSVYGRYGGPSGRAYPGATQQQSQLFPDKLLLGNSQGASPEQTKQSTANISRRDAAIDCLGRAVQHQSCNPLAAVIDLQMDCPPSTYDGNGGSQRNSQSSSDLSGGHAKYSGVVQARWTLDSHATQTPAGQMAGRQDTDNALAARAKVSVAIDPSFSAEHAEECCPKCGARQEQDTYDEKCNRCGGKWLKGESAATSGLKTAAFDAEKLKALRQRRGECPGCGEPFKEDEPYPNVEMCEVCERYGKPKTAGINEDIDAAAAECEEPKSKEQAEAGNYRHGHCRLHGMGITIETGRGMTRKGTSKSGKAWSIALKNSYGYIKRTLSEADGDHIDVFLNDGDAEHELAFIVDQVDPATGNFDEHKVMLFFPTKEAAKQAYLDNYSAGWQGFGGITAITLPDFKEWIKNGDTSKPYAPQTRAARNDKQAGVRDLARNENAMQLPQRHELQGLRREGDTCLSKVAAELCRVLAGYGSVSAGSHARSSELSQTLHPDKLPLGNTSTTGQESQNKSAAHVSGPNENPDRVGGNLQSAGQYALDAIVSPSLVTGKIADNGGWHQKQGGTSQTHTGRQNSIDRSVGARTGTGRGNSEPSIETGLVHTKNAANAKTAAVQLRDRLPVTVCAPDFQKIASPIATMVNRATIRRLLLGAADRNW